MDMNAINQEYQQLENESNNLTQKIQVLANKLQQAKESGSPDAKEWVLDLKEIALAIQSEQNQMFSLLLSIHNNASSTESPAQSQAPGNVQNQQPAKKGFFSSLLGGGIGQAMEMGLGFGLGDDLINSIF